MDIGLIFLVIVAGGILLTILALIYRIDIEMERYCPYCGQYMEIMPFKNKGIHKLFGYNRICDNLQCRYRSYPHLYQKIITIVITPITVWSIVYPLVLRQELLATKVKIFFVDIWTIFFLFIALIAIWHFYTRKLPEYKKFVLDVS